jgi:hypothetical protein
LKLPFKALACVLALTTVPCAAQERSSSPSETIDPARLALAQQVIDLAYPPDRRVQMMNSAAETAMEQTRAAVLSVAGNTLDAELTRLFDRYVERARSLTEQATDDATPAIFAAFARAYARQFTREELVEIRDFVATPTGARFFSQSEELLNDPDVARANTAYMAAVIADMQPLQTELFREVVEYLRRRDQSAAASPASGTR